MQQDTAAKTNLGIEGIVRKYLLIDPADLISLDPEKAFVAAGLHEFWRRTIKRALGLLCAPGDIRLCGSEASAKALGWPSAKLLDLSSLLAWALIREPRLERGLPKMKLRPADPKIIDLLQAQPGPGDANISTIDLVSKAVMLFKVGADAKCRAPTLDALETTSVCALIKETQGIAPEILVRAYSPQPGAEQAFSINPEEQAAVALSAFFMSVLDLYMGAAKEGIDLVRLLLVKDDDPRYQGPEDARAANIKLCHVAGLLAEGERDVGLLI